MWVRGQKVIARNQDGKWVLFGTTMPSWFKLTWWTYASLRAWVRSQNAIKAPYPDKGKVSCRSRPPSE